MLSVGGGGAVAVKHARGDRPQTAPLPRGARQSLCGCDRSAGIHGGNLLQEPQVGAGCPQASRRPHRYAGVRAALHGRRPLSGHATGPSVTPYLIASGLTGEPTAPVIGIAGATNMNSYTLSA